MQLSKPSLVASMAIAFALAAPSHSQSPIVDLDTRPFNGDSDPRAGVSVGGVAYFVATTTFGAELWRSDGTSAGTYLLKDVLPGDSGRRGSASIRDLTVVGNLVFFAASPSGYGAEIWVTDGTPLGTRLVKDILTGSGRSSAVNSLIQFRGKLYFVAADGQSGNDLWETDGTEAGTRRVTTVSVASGITQAAVGTNAFYFGGWGPGGNELWRSDGTPAGTREVVNLTRSGSTGPRKLTVVGNQVFFTASSDFGGGSELHVSDGTAAGTRRVKHIWPGSRTSSPDDFVAPGNKCLVFTVNDGVHGEELWRSDGNPAIGNSAFRLSLSSGRPTALAAVVLGGTPANLALGNCRLLVVPAVTAPTVVSNSRGAAVTPLAIPNDSGLLGGRFFSQYVVLDPNGAFHNAAAFRDGLMVKVGR